MSRLSLAAASRGYSLVVVYQLFTAVVSLFGEWVLQGIGFNSWGTQG